MVHMGDFFNITDVTDKKDISYDMSIADIAAFTVSNILNCTGIDDIKEPLDTGDIAELDTKSTFRWMDMPISRSVIMRNTDITIMANITTWPL